MGDGITAEERAYRRGCHQTAAQIEAILSGDLRISPYLFLAAMVDVLGAFRHDDKPHTMLLSEAVEEVRRPK